MVKYLSAPFSSVRDYVKLWFTKIWLFKPKSPKIVKKITNIHQNLEN